MARKSSQRKTRTPRKTPRPRAPTCLECKDGKVEPPFPFHKYLTYEEMDGVHGATITIEEMYSRAKQRKELGAPVLYDAEKRRAYDDAMVKAIRLRVKSERKLGKWQAKAATRKKDGTVL